MVRALLAAKGTVNGKPLRKSLLWVATLNDHSGVVQVLLEAKAFVNQTDTEEDVDTQEDVTLWNAAAHGSGKCARLLLQAGESVNTIDNFGDGSVHAATWLDNVDLIGLLVRGKANVNMLNMLNHGGFAPMHLAATTHVDVVRVLLRAKADPYGSWSPNLTPMQLAAQYGHVAILQELLQAKVSTEHQDEEDLTYSPVQLAAQNGRVDATHFLIRAKADINAARSAGVVTAMHLAAQENEVDVVRMLIRAKADMDRQDLIGSTPLHESVKKGNVNVVRLLLQAKADTTKNDCDRHSALHNAARKGREDVLQLFLHEKTGLDSASPLTGNTPMHVAAWYGQHRAVYLLLRAKADPNARNKCGKTVADVAKGSDVLEVLQAETRPQHKRMRV